MDHPIDFEHNLVRVFSDEETKRAYRIPSLAAKHVGELIDELLANETCPLHGSIERVDLFEVLVTQEGKQVVYLPHAKSLKDLVHQWESETSRKEFIEIRLLVKAAERDDAQGTPSSSKSAERQGSISNPKPKGMMKGLKGLKVGKLGHSRGTSSRGTDRPMSASESGVDGDSARSSEIDALFYNTDFGADTFSTEDFSSTLIRSFSDDEIRYLLDYHLTIRKEKASKRLKSSVRDNYPQFIETANEVEHLENDMLELRNHLTEVNSLIKGMQVSTINYDKSNMMLKRDPKLVAHLLGHIHWLLELPDELDILTSERLFSEAISKLVKARKLIATHPQLLAVENVIREDLNLRIKNLSVVLLKDLGELSNKKRDTQRIINNLTSLGFASQAREVFLETRSSLLGRELRKLSFGGNTQRDVNELSRLVFNTVSSTCDEFRLSFPQKTMASGLVIWAMKMMQKYTSQFYRLVFKKRKVDEWEEIGKCFEITKAYSRELEEKGLSFLFHLRQEFFKGLLESVEDWSERVESSINGQLAEEKWEAKAHSSSFISNGILDSSFRLSESGAYIYNVLSKFSSILPMCSAELLPVVANALSLSLEKYFFELSTMVESPKLSSKQCLTIVSNALYLSTDIIPRFKMNSDAINGDLDSLANRISVLYQDIENRYCQSIGTDIVFSKFDWPNTKYQQETLASPSGSMGPTSKFPKLFEFLLSVAEQVREVMGIHSVKRVVSSIIDIVFNEMSKGPFWEHEDSQSRPMFRKGGISQFILDCKYSLSASSIFVSEKASNCINDMIERALISYCRYSGTSDPRSVLLDDESYKRVTKEALTNSKENTWSYLIM